MAETLKKIIAHLNNNNLSAAYALCQTNQYIFAANNKYHAVELTKN